LASFWLAFIRNYRN